MLSHLVIFPKVSCIPNKKVSIVISIGLVTIIVISFGLTISVFNLFILIVIFIVNFFIITAWREAV